MSNHTVYIYPHERKIQVADESSLLGNLIEHAIFLRSDCGGKGVCGKCLVKIRHADGDFETTEACRIQVSGDISIDIPATSIMPSYIIKKAPAILPVSFKQSFDKNKKLPPSYGIALDIGTTTIALYLCDMNSGRVLSSMSVKNPQAIYGDDVMSRIGAVEKDEENLARLQKLVVHIIEWACQELVRSLKKQLSSIEKVVVVGNPTMIQLFLGINPTSIGVAPYKPAFYEAQSIQGQKLGFEQLTCLIQTLPQISGFLGGDILAAALGAEVGQCQDGTLLVDIGTNGEIIYKGKNEFYATSCATGPAFEGATLSCGMQAIPGAIDKVIFAGASKLPEYSMIQSSKEQALTLSPAGLCGSGVISATAELYRNGVIDSGGAMALDKSIISLQKDASGTKKYIIAARGDGKGVENKEVFINQKDIRSIQLGKAALITGIEFLLKKEGVERPENIVVAGAFGSYLDKKDMMTLGMIPQVHQEKIEMAGNLAGAGAVMVLCNEHYLELAQEMATRIEVVDLATNIEFQKAFVDNLKFPRLLRN